MTAKPSSPAPNPPGGVIDGSRHLFAVRAYFEDTDLSGVVYHANYLRWFERARSDFVRLLGIDQRAVNEAGEGAFAVADLTIRYVAPARLDATRVRLSRTDRASGPVAGCLSCGWSAGGPAVGQSVVQPVRPTHPR